MGLSSTVGGWVSPVLHVPLILRKHRCAFVLVSRRIIESWGVNWGRYTSDKGLRNNRIRHCINTFFKNRDCITLVRPLEDEGLLQEV